MDNRKNIFIGALIVIIAHCTLNKVLAQELGLSRDTSVKTGILKNGFRYYIKRNLEPAGRATMYLANKVGSIVENEQERGIAHFIEHMNFNGTKHFPKNELIGYLERSGVKFGADLNAYTSYDETVYKLPLPTNDAALWNNGMQILRDWAADATLDKIEFDKERGVIQEERRQRLNASSRLAEQYQPLLFNQSRYAQRMPIGLDNVILHADVSVAQNFYKRWYRPDLQAIIIVGDINVDQVQQQVIKLFSDLQLPEKPAERIPYRIPLKPNKGFLKVGDPEFTQYAIQYFFKQLNQPLKTPSDFKRRLLERLVNLLFANRLSEKYDRSKPAYSSARADVGPLVANLDALRFSVSLNPNTIESGFKAFWSTIEQVGRFGFTPEELSLAKDRTNRSMEIAKSENNKTSSAAYADDYLKFFLTGDAYLSGFERDALYHRFIAQISSQDINNYIKQYLNSSDQTVLVIGPDKGLKKLPDEKLLNEWMSDIGSMAVEPYQLAKSSEKLLRTLPKPGRISKQEKEENGIYHWQLDNGLNIFAKSTDYRNDQVLISGFSGGGTSLYSQDDFISAKYAAGFVTSSGLGEFNGSQLSQLLNKKAVQIQPYIAERREGFSGGSASKDLPTAMEMIYLYMSEPKLDTAKFNSIITLSREAFNNRLPDPIREFSDTVDYVLSGYHLRRKPAAMQDFSKIDSAKVKSIFYQRFSNPGDFTFVFTGNFEIDSLKKWSAQYLGAIPPNGKAEAPKDLNIRVPKGQFRKDIRSGKSNKATVQMVLSGGYEYGAVNNLYIDLLTETLQSRLVKRLREDEGGVYSPRVNKTKSKEPINFYAFTISFECDPARMEQLINAAKEEISKLAQSGVTLEELGKFRAESQRSQELALRSNQFWLEIIQQQIMNNDPLKDLFIEQQAMKNLNTKDSITQSKKLLSQENCIIFTLRPL